ncbi:PREDICTED: nucleotide exchange factor SIL1-like [Amphimedon queenslandica]|uniref:Nucleotide exchange factor Fes1 domain-containing protein n=1 Tax=Amphimedon queenslandica TaxID=400682 RepID=A0A1X7VFY0_AMPQE|nr:PREDICTED: nucleotide exchange factor SIL1-like [Amphimedon queenslandica]|eukprot:XP_011410426.1 PREDICTED: nucleotide exchange factor SIL1-like [Amphimedon queenslandica]
MDGITSRLKGILNWSIRQQERGNGGATQTQEEHNDPQRLEWLKEVLHSVSTKPSETDLLKGALSILEIHSDKPSFSQEELDALKQSFEDVEYFVEDLDHASDLIPLKGIATISKYLLRNESDLVGSACSIITNASQNHEPCQKEFTQSSLNHLIQLLSGTNEGLQRKAISAISSLVRGYSPARELFLENDGPNLLLSSLYGASDRLSVKIFFFLQHLYIEPHSNLELLIDDLIDAINKNIKTFKDNVDLLEQSLLTLHQMLQTYPERTRLVGRERGVVIDSHTLQLLSESVSEETQEKLKELSFN